MNIFINGTSAISPQASFDGGFPSGDAAVLQGNRSRCIEPDYSAWIDAKAIRRMSRIIRMGVTSAKKTCGNQQPDAIIVGTAYGCLEDTNQFLSRMTEYKEDMLNPTPFIHSTHNTITSQIALHFKCYGYNSTYVHRSISFESALMDAMLLIHEGTAKNVLAGGVDEIIDESFIIMDRLKMYGKADDPHGSGAIAGEGSAFFLLSNEKTTSSLASLKMADMLSFASADEVAIRINELTSINQPDLVLAGFNGNADNDSSISTILHKVLPGIATHSFKQYCGEYPTSTAYALWLATQMVSAPVSINSLHGVKNILIYNQTANIHHSFILVSSC